MTSSPPYLYKLRSRFLVSLQQGRNSVFSLLFPWHCPICHELQKYAAVLCESCRLTLPRIEKGLCRICGSPFPDHWRVKVCPECELERPKLTRIRSVFEYETAVIQMIREMKFGRRARYARYFAEEMYVCATVHFRTSIDAIVPVPLHRIREWQRTFDQARLLAMYLGELSGIPMRNALRRCKNTAPQTSLSGLARRKNLENAFQWREGCEVPKSVLLIDDVITTGATLEACAKILREKGVRRIYGLTIARAVKDF